LAVRDGLPFELTLEEGSYLVRLARRSIEAAFAGGEADISDAPKIMLEPCGAFVTLNSLRGGSETLCGCIGYPTPVKPLAEAVREVARAAAFEDPRFASVRKSDLKNIVIEVSVLTPPEIVWVEKPSDYPGEVRVGVDGIIVRRGYWSGLLLPQVAPEWGWGPEEFLSNTCAKAGLPPDCWLQEGTEVSKFQAIIFSEASPGGDVVKKEAGS